MKMTDEKRAWLLSPAANELRALYKKQADLSANQLMAKGMTSSDPECRTHAIAFATWKAALKELDPQHDPD